MKEKLLYRKRVWLNPDPASGAYVKTYVDRTEWDERDPSPRVTLGGEFCIADCSRIIRLDIDGWSKAGRKRTVKKFRKLANVINEVADVIEGEFDE